MNIAVILCHPRQNSFCHAIADHAAQALRADGHAVVEHDLYDEMFDPVLTAEEMRRGFSFDEQVQDYADTVSRSDGLVIVHPDWWSQPPALLKGWVDRVFRQGVAYEYEGGEFERKKKVPLLTQLRALVFCTTDAQATTDASPLVRLWTESVFGFCGAAAAQCRVFHDVRDSTYQQRRGWLDEVESSATGFFGER